MCTSNALIDSFTSHSVCRYRTGEWLGRGLVSVAEGRLSTALTFTVRDEKIVEFDLITDPVRLKEIEITRIYEPD